MTRSLIGYNVHDRLTYERGYSAEEKERMWRHFERLQPASLMFLDNFDWAREAKRRLPNTIVVFRQYRSNDGRFFMNMTPQQFYDGHAQFGDAGLVVSVMNEPTGYGEQNKPEDLEKVAEFMRRVMDLHGRAGHAICGPEFGVGHPDLSRLSELDEMWAAFKRWPQHYYGAHEYGTYRGMQYTDETHQRDVYPHRVGRYKSILAYVKEKYGYDLPFLANEFGIDSSFYQGDDTNKRGWRDAGISDLDYAKMLIRCTKEIYTEPNVKGLNIFAHGNTGKQFTGDDWKTHDVSFLPSVQVALEDYAAAQPTVPPPPPEQPTVITILPTDARFTLLEFTLKSTGAVSFLRDQPGIGANIVVKFVAEKARYIPLEKLAESEKRFDKVELELDKKAYWLPVLWQGRVAWVRQDAVEILSIQPEPPELPDDTPTAPSEEELLLVELRRAYTAIGTAYNNLAIASARYAEHLKKRETEIRERRLKPAA